MIAMSNYTLRDIDPELWRKLKVKAASEGKPIRTVLIELVTKYTAHKKENPS